MGFEYCPYETLQIINTGSFHWILLSSFNGKVKLYDSLNTELTPETVNQMNQLFSPNDSTPPHKRVLCHKQAGSSDCGLVAIAYAIDLLHGDNPKNIIYDQSKMRDHFLKNLEEGKITPFPKYNNNVPYRTHESPDFGTQLSPWKQPRRSARLKAKKANTISNCWNQ